MGACVMGAGVMITGTRLNTHCTHAVAHADDSVLTCIRCLRALARTFAGRRSMDWVVCDLSPWQRCGYLLLGVTFSAWTARSSRAEAQERTTFFHTVVGEELIRHRRQ